MFLTRSHTSQAFSYLLHALTHLTHILTALLHSLNSLALALITSHAHTLSFPTRYYTFHSLTHFLHILTLLTDSHISLALLHLSRLFLAPLTCSKSAILRAGKNAINRGNMHYWPKHRYNTFRLRDKLFYRSDGCPQRPCCWESLQWSRTFTHSASSCGKFTLLHYSRITDIQMKKLWNSLKRLVGPFAS